MQLINWPSKASWKTYSMLKTWVFLHDANIEKTIFSLSSSIYAISDVNMNESLESPSLTAVSEC